jgi:glycosyl-4,4'-diaponeurosporenoate acyltransferase
MPVVMRLVLISLAWIVLQVGSGYITYRMPRRFFAADCWFYRARRWEKGGATYNRLFRIKRWKDSLPEAGALFPGGISKRDLQSRTIEHVQLFVMETRRAELTHWLPVLFSFSFFAWNPVNVAIWMPVVGFVGNVPFIMVQRYIRPRLAAIVER